MLFARALEGDDDRDLELLERERAPSRPFASRFDAASTLRSADCSSRRFACSSFVIFASRSVLDIVISPVYAAIS